MAPLFDDDREITPKFEIEVHSYYDLRCAFTTGESGAYYAEGTTETTGVGGSYRRDRHR